MGSLDEVLTRFCAGVVHFVFEPNDLSVHGPGVRVCRQGCLGSAHRSPNTKHSNPLSTEPSETRKTP